MLAVLVSHALSSDKSSAGTHKPNHSSFIEGISSFGGPRELNKLTRRSVGIGLGPGISSARRRAANHGVISTDETL